MSSNNKINVLILLDVYVQNTGASGAAIHFLENWMKNGMGGCFLCYRTAIGSISEYKEHIFEFDGNVSALLINKQIDIVNYYKSSRSLLKQSLLTCFHTSIKKDGIRVPIVTTVCQQPSFVSVFLTTSDIKQSDAIVFIDKQAYNDPLYSFIPCNRKTQIYFGTSRENIDKLGSIADKSQKSDKLFVYGRGSSIEKCPKDILDVFSKINVPKKLYRIVGVAAKSWLGKLAAGYNDVEIIEHVSYWEWLEVCASFNVFLYYLPEHAHSSIDGTLGDAMLMKIPPIVYGANAPKERIIHGKNGFIANTKDEIVKYAELLYTDTKLRERMGEAARSSQIEMFDYEITLSKYRNLFSEMTNSYSKTMIHIPLKNRLELAKKHYGLSFWIFLINTAYIKMIYFLKRKGPNK